MTDPRTDRRTLTTVAYGSGDRLADRAQIYRFQQPALPPMAEWLFGFVGGAGALATPVVDVGAGSGQYIADLPQDIAVGVDLSRGMLEGIRAAGFLGMLLEADAQAIPLGEATVGTAMANHMLYHVPDIALAIRELRRVVRADGVVLVVTNAPDHLAALGGVLDSACHEVCGRAFHLDRSGERFNLDNGATMLSDGFAEVTRHDREGEIVVPDAEAVMRYLSSLEGLAGLLPGGVCFDDVLAAARPKVDEVIARDGAFRVRAHAGAFICR